MNMWENAEIIPHLRGSDDIKDKIWYSIYSLFPVEKMWALESFVKQNKKQKQPNNQNE